MNENARRSDPRNTANPRGSASSDRRGYKQRPRTAFQWSDIPQDRIGDIVHIVTNSGAAIMLGVTSDGGALSVTILDGDDRIREWPHTIEEFDALYDWLRNSYDRG